MICRILRTLRHLDRYELVGIACGVLLLCVMTGVLGPTLDAQSTLQAQDSGRNTAVAAHEWP